MATVQKPPPAPKSFNQWVDKDGRPTKEFFDFIAKLIAWAKEADAELE